MAVVEPGRFRGRLEDPPLLRGAGRYVADIAVEGCVDLAFARSTEPHGVLRAVHLGDAARRPGVVGAYTAADLPDLPLTPPTAANAAAARGRDWPPLAVDRVRYVGEPIAAVVADDRYRAEDALDGIWADVDALPLVAGPAAAVPSGAPALFPGSSNVALELGVGDPDAADAVAACPVVVEWTYDIPRVAHLALEGRAILVVPTERELTVWCSHQAPQRLRDGLAGAFGDLGARALRVRVPDVGGAFGQKSHMYPEYVVAVALALRHGRPVRWVEDRWEALTASTHGRGQHQRVRLGATEDGTVRAVHVEIDADIGAYPHVGAYVPTFTGLLLSGPYALASVGGRVRAVLTNKVPTCPYRGAGRPEAAYALERTIDALAHELGLDPAEVRRRNFVPRGAFPYRTPTGAVYESGDYAAAQARALELAGYATLRREQRRRREAGERPLGIGLCSFVERSGGVATTREHVVLDVAGDGRATVHMGTTSTGQGHRTAFAGIVSRALGLAAAEVDVRYGDTATAPAGIGTFASRSMQVGGAALHEACQRCIDELTARAAGMAGEPVRFEAGTFAGATGSRALRDVLAATGAVRAEADFESPRAFPSGSYVAVVEVDVDTGVVEVLRLVAVDDCGVRVEPVLVEGQTLGSMVQGLGQALYEEVGYREGQPVAASLLDYAVPTASEAPPIVTGAIETPNPLSPIGAKGAGEGGCLGVPPAVLNAVVDALRPYGVRDVAMPASPARIWAALQEAGG